MRVSDPLSGRKLRGELRDGLSTLRGGLFIPFGNDVKCFFNTATGDGGDGHVREGSKWGANGERETEREETQGQRTVLTISETPVGVTRDGGYSTLEDAVGIYILIET